MKLGFIGLGRMGKNMVFRLLEQGIEVVAWNRSPDPREEVARAGAEVAQSVEELVQKLEVPRIIWLMLPAGETTDEFIDKLIPLLTKGDLIVDGANSFYKDTLRRYEKLLENGIEFMDVGVSGGPGGARNGACLMIGGSSKNYQRILEVVKAASAPNAYGHFGKVGAGHFAKMVHNGIEYGMMEALAEGVNIMDKSQFEFNLAEVLRVYNNGSVVESRLVGWLLNAIKEDPQLLEIDTKIGSTGEGEWTANTAEELGVDARVIKDSFQVRVESEGISEEDKDAFRNEPKALSSANAFRNKAVSAMRGQFGQHKVKKVSS